MNKPYGEAFGQIGEEEDPFIPLEDQVDPFSPEMAPAGQEQDQAPDDSVEDPFAPEAQDPFEPVATEETQDEEPTVVTSSDPFAPEEEEIPYDATLPEPVKVAVAETPEPESGEAELSANSLMNYASSAAEQIGKLFGTSKEATSTVLVTRMKSENDKMLQEGWDRSQDFSLFDAELRKRTQAHVGELLTEGTKVEQMGGPDALLEGRENMVKRKAAKGKAIDDFDVNLVSRSLGSGFLQTGAGLLDAGATVASIAGLDNIEKYLTDKGKALLDVQGYIPFEVNGVDDVSNILDAGALVTKATGEMAPQIALSYLAGGALLAGAGAVPVTSQLAMRSPTAIRMAGGFVANAALETGGIAREQIETSGKISPGFAVGGGLAAASLETYADAKLFKNLWKMLKVPDREVLLKDLATKSTAQIIKTIGVNSIKQSGTEFVTEGAQEGINYLSADLAKNDPDFIKNITSGEFDPKYWGQVMDRLVDSGVQGAAGGLGISAVMGTGTSAYYTNKARRIYGEMKTAEKEVQDNLEILRQAADAAEKAGSPKTAEVMREERTKQANEFLSRKFDDQGLPEIMAMDEQETEQKPEEPKAGQETGAQEPKFKPREEFRKPQEQAQEKQVPVESAPEDDLSNYEPTGDTFDSEEAAGRYLDTLSNSQDYQIVDNTDVDSSTGEILPEYMLIKRKVPISQNEEQGSAQPAEATPKATQPAPETSQAVQQPEAVAVEQAVQPAVVEQGPQAVDPAIEEDPIDKVPEDVLERYQDLKNQLEDEETAQAVRESIMSKDDNVPYRGDKSMADGEWENQDKPQPFMFEKFLKKPVAPSTDIEVEEVPPAQEKDLEEIISDAADSQRGKPESVMMDVTMKLKDETASSPSLIDLLEHVGDLSNRAQKRNAITNVEEKIRKVERYGQDGRNTLEEEIKQGYRENAEYRILKSIPELAALRDRVGEPGGPTSLFEVYERLRKEHGSKIEAEIKRSKEIAKQELKKYVEAHEKFNKPVTKLGKLGKDAAIALGNQDFNQLRSIVLEMRKWVDAYNKANPGKRDKMFNELAEKPTPAPVTISDAADSQRGKPEAQLSDDQKTLTKLPERDFVSAIQTLVNQNSPESRASAHDMLFERYMKASSEGKGNPETSRQLMGSLTAKMAENNENPDKVERWQVQRSTDALTTGLFSESGLGTEKRPGKGWNAYAPNVKGVGDYQTKIYNQVMTQVQSILNDIKKGSRGRVKAESTDGRKTPPVISDPMEQWVEYGKNLASNIAKNAVLRVGEANKNSKLTSFDALENTKISEDKSEKYTDEGEEVELAAADAPTWQEEENEKEDTERSKVGDRAISLIREGVGKIRNASNSPLHKAVVDYHLGKLGVANESGFDATTTYDEVGESVIKEVTQPNGEPYSFQSISRMARDMGPEIGKQILDVLKLQNANANEETYRSIIRPEAVKKENRKAKSTAKGNRQLKSSVFYKINELKNLQLISNYEKTQLLDVIPNELTEELTDQLNAELDNAAEQEDLDSEQLIQNIKERIQNYDTQEYANNEGSIPGYDQRAEVYVQDENERTAQGTSEQPDSPKGQRSSAEPAVPRDSQNVQSENVEAGSPSETEDVDGGVSPDQGAVDEAAGKAWKATLDRANKAAELGIIDNNALEIIQSGLTSLISDPNSDFDSTISALSDFLDAAENKALQDELEGEGIAAALGEGSSRGSERPQRSEPGVQGLSDKGSSTENRQGVRDDASKQKTVPRGDKESGRAQEVKAGDGVRGQAPAEQVDNGPRPGLATSFEKFIPAPKKEYVKLGDFGLDENQVKAVNLMVQAFEEGKKAFILGDGTGMGKTLTYMVAGQLIAEMKGTPVLLVALNKLWLEQRFEADLKRFGLKRSAFFVQTYDQVRADPSLSAEYFPAVIFDEAHQLKNDETKTSQMAAKLQTGFKIFATATPLDEVKQAAYFLSELTGESEDQVLTSLGFNVSYEADPNVPGGLRRRLTSRENRTDTDRALGELATQAVRNGQMIRRYYPFWGKRDRFEVKLTEDQAKDYQKQLRYWERQEGMSSNPGLVRGQKTQALKRWTETIKGKYILENSLKWLEENPTGKIVIMADTAGSQKIKGLRGSKAEVQGVAGFLNDAFNAKGFKTVRIFGTKNEKETYGPLRQFQSQDLSVRVAVSTIASGGTGIDLDDQFGNRPRLVWFAGTNFAASKVEQAQGRTSRRSTKSPSELRIVMAPESFGDSRSEDIKNQKMLNLRAIQGQALDEEQTSEGGKLSSENTSFVPMTKYYEDAEVSPFEGAKVDTRLEEYEPEVQNTVKEFSKIAGRNFPGTKIVFGEYGKATAWADPGAISFDTIFVNPELLNGQFKDSLAGNPAVAQTAMEFVVDEEMSHNNYFKSAYDEAASLGVEPTEYLNEELNKIASGLTEGIKEKVRSRYEVMGGGKIQSNHHLVMEYMRMLDQYLRKGATTEMKLTLQPGTPNVFAELLPRSSVPMDGQNALYRMFDSLINFFKGILSRQGMSPVAAKAVKERLEKLDKMFKETSNPILGTFGNRPSFNAQSKNIPVPASSLKVSSEKIANNKTLLGMHQKFKTPSESVTGKTRKMIDKIIAYFPSQVYDFLDPVAKKEGELVRAIREEYPEDIDKLAPLDFGGKDLFPAERSAYKLMRLSKDAWQTTSYALHHGIPIWEDGSVAIKPGSKGLIETLGQLGNVEDADLFRLYMVAKRSEELQALGKDSGFTQKEIEEGVDLGNFSSSKGVRLSEIFSQYREFQDGVLQFAVDSGLVSPGLKEILNQLHKNYVPFYRVVDVVDVSPDTPNEKLSGPFSRSQVAGQRSGIKRYKGGEDPIGDLYENIEKNIAHLIQASVRNTAMLRLERINGDLDMLTGQNFWAPVSPGMVVSASAKDFTKYLRSVEGIDISDSDIDSGALVRVFGIAGRKDKNSRDTGIISFMRRGKATYRKIEEGNRTLLEALTISESMGNRMLSSGFMKLFTIPKTLFQRSITLMPDFMAVNVFRDAVSAFLTNKVSTIPLLNTIRGAVALYTKKDELAQIRGQGAGNPSSYSSARKAEGIYDLLPQLKNKTLAEKTFDTANEAIGMLDKIGETTESIHRIAVTMEAMNRSKLSPAEAAWIYKQSTTDFSAHGANIGIRFLAAAVPFFNAGVQSMYRIWGSYADGAKITNKMSPTQQFLEKLKPKNNELMKRGALLALFALIYASLQSDDERYKDLPDYEKDNYFIFFIGGTKVRIRKPFEVGTVFFTLPEMMANAVFKKELPDVWRVLSNVGSIFRGALPGLPQLIRPVAELVGNKDFFTMNPIIPRNLQDIAPSMQSREATPSILTDGTARIIGVKDTPYFGSPLVQQKLVEGYFGTMGKYFLFTASAGFDAVRGGGEKAGVEKDWQEWVFAKSFFAKSGDKKTYTAPTYPTKYGKEFYEIAREITVAENTMRGAKKLTNETRQDEYENEYGAKSELAKEFRQLSEEINNVEDDIRGIRSDDGAKTPTERKDELNQLLRDRNLLFKEAVKTYKDWKKDNK